MSGGSASGTLDVARMLKHKFDPADILNAGQRTDLTCPKSSESDEPKASFKGAVTSRRAH